jgi:hypothetical protein
MRRILYSINLILPLAFAAGCASFPAPTERMASSEAAARSAREVGAERVPQASLQLRLSEEQIARAKALMAEGDNEQADLLLQRAQADAELSLSLAREDQARKEAAQLVAQVAQLRAQVK